MNEKNYYEQTDAQFKIRLPHELKEKIRQSAEQYNRTMTADIVARLENSFLDIDQHLEEQINSVASYQKEVDEKFNLLIQEIQALKKPT